MPQRDVTITQPQAQQVLASWLGRDVSCTRIERLHGGQCYSVLRLHFDQPPYQAVIKLDADPTSAGFTRERDNLLHVRRHTSCLCPQVYLEDSTRTMLPYAFLLLESLPGLNLEAAGVSPDHRRRIDQELADVLLELHSHTRATFGEVREAGTPCWLDIFLPRLLELQQDMQTRLPTDVLRNIEIACCAAPEVLADQGAPTLVHGDLWPGNLLVVRRADGWHLSGLIDWPALQYADVEYELAYLEAWLVVTPVFFESYTRVRPLRPGYERRRLFYWLHTYMLHVWLYGAEDYRQRTATVARRIGESLA